MNRRASPPKRTECFAGAPGDPLADLEVVVPVAARRAQERVANRIVALDVEPRQAERVAAAVSDAGNPELGHEVGAVRGFAEPVQAHAREAEARLGQQTLRRRVDQRHAQVLDAIVVIRAETRQVLRREAVLIAQAVTAEQGRRRSSTTDRGAG